MFETLILMLVAVLAYGARKRLRLLEARLADIELRLTGRTPVTDAAPSADQIGRAHV